MIPERELNILIAFSKENSKGDMELDTKIAPQEVVDIAKKFYWKPFNKKDGETYEL